jgi:hypothetical protein
MMAEEVVVVARRGMRCSGVSLSKAGPRSTHWCKLVNHAVAAAAQHSDADQEPKHNAVGQIGCSAGLSCAGDPCIKWRALHDLRRAASIATNADERGVHSNAIRAATRGERALGAEEAAEGIAPSCRRASRTVLGCA